MEFCLLGPLVVRCGGAEVPVQRGNQQIVLAMLLLDANRIVPVGDLAEALWSSRPPPSASVTIRNYVKRLRQALDDAGRTRISTKPGGYQIRVNVGELDLSRFEVLLRSAQVAARKASWCEASAYASTALSLWRGEPLADIKSDWLAQREVPRLSELRLRTLEARIDADLHLGRHADVIAELRHLVGTHPLRENLHALLMLALFRCGCQGDALAAYRDARHVLVEEIGSEPGAGLREMHQRILSSDPALAAPVTSPTADGGPRSDAPRELPGTAHFVGREGELATLTGLLDQADKEAPGTVVISAVGGTAGVGKTALAVYWAHQVAQRFPDGQLYMNLRGFGPWGTPLAPTEAIRRFLDVLGVPVDRIPPDLAAQASLYRSVLAHQKVLIVLDNARDEQQVRPLLPADPGCLVIVTSRNQLAGLAAAEGARLLTLDVLTHAEARQVIAGRIGTSRLDAEPAAASELIELCASLPLALAITAARAATRPRLALASLADEMRDARDRLDALTTGENATDVRVVLSWSYQQLSPATARMFCLLGIHSGPDITAEAAASLVGVPPLAARRQLRELTRCHLLAESSPGRYAFHDLLRAYASEQAADHDDDFRRAALARVLDHYLHTAHAAALLLEPSREPIILAPPQPWVTPEHLPDSRLARAWFEAERHVLITAIALAAETGFDIHTWQLAWTMTDFLDWRGHWYEQADIQRMAVAAAMRLGDSASQAATLRLLATTCGRLGDYDRARAHLAESLGLYRKLGDRVGESHISQSLAWLSDHEGRFADALGHAKQALSLLRTAGHQGWQAIALNNVGWCHIRLGDAERARTFCLRALVINHDLGNRHSQAVTWDTLGYAEHQLGRSAKAAACYQHAICIFRELGDRLSEAATLTNLGDTRHSAGFPEQAQDAWQQALSILADLHHPDADQVRAKLCHGGGNPPNR
jgi:DNA-binding SARP family transcriptional activator/tetratricopeptide (TPR) repeat protein